MDYHNDERYWNISLLNKWFGISSVLFFLSMIWIFIHDNDDEFKEYQRQFRNLEIKTASDKFSEALEDVKGKRDDLDKRLKEVELEFANNKDLMDKAKEESEVLRGEFYKSNMDFLALKAEIDVLKYKYEAEKDHSKHEEEKYEFKYKEVYYEALEKANVLKLINEEIELKKRKNKEIIKNLESDLEFAKTELNTLLKKVNLYDNQLSKLDRSKMSFENKVGDVFRDLPIVDFMDPYYKVNQIVVDDIKYDVNFASVPSVDRCNSCHLGIDNPDYVNAPQPFTTHPDLDLYLSSSSPHPIESFGCTGCHDGRGRGTSFIASVHMPNSKEQKSEWKENYDWEKMHHWLKPMLPTKYSQAGCFKCHHDKPDLKGGEKLALGLHLIDKKGCNGCHLIATYPQKRKAGPPLYSEINQKFDKSFARKWIRNPQGFRYNTSMPNFFHQDNNSDPESIRRSNAEIYAITEFLFKDGEKVNNNNKFIGDASNGENLFNTIGCMGCHIIKPSPDKNYKHKATDYEMSESIFGYNNHAIDYDGYLNQHGPNLIGLGSKTSSEWIYNWIKDPKSYHSKTVMPSLRLSDKEARDITAYLLSFRNFDFEKTNDIEYDPEEIENITFRWLKKSFTESEAESMLSDMSEREKINYVADKSIRFYGCFACHDIPGYEEAKPIGTELTYQGSKPVSKLDFGFNHDIEHINHAWYEQKLASPRIFDRNKVVQHEDKSRMPNFYLKPYEIEAIVTAILSFNSDKVGQSKIAPNPLISDKALEGHKLIQQFNCKGCHIIDDIGGKIVETVDAPEFSAPNLNTQGAKVQPDWLFSFLQDPTMIRPNLQLRMPSFDLNDEQWNQIIESFQYRDNNFASYESEYKSNKNDYKWHAGKKLQEIGACNNCHFYGAQFPLQGPQTWAPNLAITKDRLRPEWVVEWLRDPQSIMPGTKMPSPYLPSTEILEAPNASKTWTNALVKTKGNQDSMLWGITNYIYSIEGKKDISKEVKNYFKQHGYDFKETEEEEEEEW